MNTDDLRDEYGKSVSFNCEKGDEAFTDDYVLWLEKQLLIPRVSNCGGAIPYDSLSDSFKKSIDSIEDNLNK